MSILTQSVGDFISHVKTPRLQGSARVTDALEMMSAYETDIVAVECEGDFVGVFTRADYRTTVLRQGLNPWETILYEVMTADCPYMHEEATVKDAYDAMLAGRREFMPVLRGKTLQAILSLRALGDHIMQAYEKSETEYRTVMNYLRGGESYAFADYQ